MLSRSSEEGVAAGYVSAQLVANAAALRGLIADMHRTARSAGYVLGEVYVERTATAPAAFGDLVAHLYRDARALVVPSLHHLTLIDGGLTAGQYLPLANVLLLVASEWCLRRGRPSPSMAPTLPGGNVEPSDDCGLHR